MKASRAFSEVGPSAAADDAEALRVAADMASNLGGPEIAKLLHEVARRLEAYGYG